MAYPNVKMFDINKPYQAVRRYIYDLEPWGLRSFFALTAAKIVPLLIVEVSWLDKCSWLEKYIINAI